MCTQLWDMMVKLKPEFIMSFTQKYIRFLYGIKYRCLFNIYKDLSLKKNTDIDGYDVVKKFKVESNSSRV